MSDTYNGWTNWETWNVVLWITNEETTYRAMIRKFHGDTYHNGIGDVAERFCKEILGGKTPDMESPKEMETVNWEEVAESFIQDANS